MNEEGQAALFSCAQNGDGEAMQEIAAANLGLVRFVVRRMRAFGYEEEELYQQGCLGLVKAIKRFDAAQGTRFSTYAIPVILGEMRRYMRDNTALHVGRRYYEMAAKAQKAKARLQQLLGREPTIAEIALLLRVDPAELIQALESRQEVMSLDAPSDGAGEGRDFTQILADPRADQWMERLLLEDALSRLPEVSAKVMYLRYIEGFTQAEAAKRLDVSQVTVSRLEARARSTMRVSWAESG